MIKKVSEFLCWHSRASRLLQLAAQSDVLIENFLPSKVTASTCVAERLLTELQMPEMGLGYEHLSKLNPRLIYASLTGYGATGPLAEKPGSNRNHGQVC